MLALPALATVPQPSLPFVESMQTSVQDWRGQLLNLRDAADETAAKLIAGGHVYVAPTQKSFEEESLGRAGGLMLTKGLSPKTVLTADDTVLAAMDAGADPAALDAVLQQAHAAGAKVLLFAGPSRGKISAGDGVQLFPSQPFQDISYTVSPGVESVNNVIGMWTWTAELVACCVRRGHMPTAYTSNFMPGAIERNAQFRKVPFHTVTNVTPDSVVNFGARYLDALSRAFNAMDQTQAASFERGAKMIRDAEANGHHVEIEYLGHMFPTELQGPNRPDWRIAPKYRIDNTLPTGLSKGDVVLFLQYQQFPWDFTTGLQGLGVKSIITSSMPPMDHWATDADIDYINPFWEVQDAAVPLPG